MSVSFNSKRQLLFSILIPLLVFPFVGFFVGRYIDVNKNKQELLAYEEHQQKLDQTLVTYNNESLGISFEYPASWNLREEDNSYSLSDDLSTSDEASTDTEVTKLQIIVQSPDRSLFVYMKADDNETEETIICLTDGLDNDVTTTDSITNEACEDKGSFQRFRFYPENTSDEAWKIAEYDKETRTYKYNLNDGIYYQITNSDDLSALDKIMLSFKRIN